MKLTSILKTQMPNPSKQIIRKSISDAQLRSELRKLFSKGITQKSDAYGQIRTKFSMGRSRFWKMYDSVHADWAKLKDKAENEGITEATKEAAKNGLKSKLEKQLELQNEINLIDKQIKGEVQFTFVVGNKVNKSHNGDIFMLPVQIQNELRARKLQYYSELNKMNGDYAPTKVANTDKDGNDVKQVIIIGGKEVQF